MNFARGEGIGCIEIGGYMNAGKTATAVALVIDFLINQTYFPEEVISNVEIRTLGVPRSDNRDIIDFISGMVENEITDRLILIDEADQVFKHREYTDKMQRKVLPNIWQLAKLGNTLIYTDHRGLGVDSILRDATIMSIEPQIDKNNDRIILDVIDGRFKGPDGRELRYQGQIKGLDVVFESYYRRAPVK
jgi:hypothetical protein